MEPFPTKTDVKRVCVVGPECTGKSALASFLANHYHTPYVDEYARNYLAKLNRPYQESDLIKIAHGQIRMEDEWLRDANRVLICDTNLLVVKVWSEYKYGKCNPEILAQHANRKYDLYLLTYVDIPWEEDPQREHPDKREHFWKIYFEEVRASGVPFVEIRGERDERRASAIAAINRLLLS
jgi:NadR type nicotinamide-nucleotide adenylyltransferase